MNILKKAQATAGVGAAPQTFSSPAPPPEVKPQGVREQRTLKYHMPQQLKDETGKAMKLEKGEQRFLSAEEEKEFANTEYQNGMVVNVYDGEVRDKDKRDGQGVYYYNKGEMFEGTWRVNKRHGQGMLTMTTGHRYEGQWKDDMPDGEGREEFSRGEVYQGEYSKGRMHGRGVLDYHTTGTIFEGEYEDGRKSGKGRLLYSNGDVFEGTWKNGRREGKGTTTYAATGRVYESTWKNGALVGDMVYVRKGAPPKVNRPPARNAHVKLSKETSIPPALSKMRPNLDATEAQSEHLLRLQIAFEALDKECSGAVAYADLEAKWDEENRDALELLDPERTGSVDLYGLLRAWYPKLPRRDIERYLSTFVTPEEVMRHRGELAGVPSNFNKGFVFLADANGMVDLNTLKANRFIIGGERFSENSFRKSSARSDRASMTFTEMLDVWYPHVPYNMIARYEAKYLPGQDVNDIVAVFNDLASEGVLIIEDFVAAQDAWQQWLVDNTPAPGQPPSVAFADLPSTPQTPLHRVMQDSAFRGEPVWPFGPISVTVNMLQTIDSQKGGWVTLTDLLCFCYPNIDCVWTRMRFLNRKEKVQECECDIHRLTGDSVVEQLGH